jgi:ferritin-like metal-binding protein YciE
MKKLTSQPETENENENSEPMDHDLHELLLDELADLHNAEQQLTKALPKMIKAAQSEELKTALEEHLKETEGHVDRLEEAFQSLDEKLKRKVCAAMKGIIEKASELLQEQKGKTSIDAAIIAAAQKVEHYEIASYGTVHAWAERLDQEDVASLLSATLGEEKAADQKLTEISESVANQD